MITEVQGDLLTSKSQVIAHQVNCQGVMGSGIAKQIKEKYPKVFGCYEFHCNVVEVRKELLGQCDLCENEPFYIANLFGQYDYGTHKRMTNYEAIYNALENLHKDMINLNLTSVSFPYKMSCGLAGGDWHVVYAMIESIFKDMDVTIYKL